MNETLFRKASLDRVSSPEQLNDYIRISNPGVWMILASIIILLVGVCVWGTLGTLETTAQAVTIVKSGVATCYVTEIQVKDISKGMIVHIGKTKGMVASVENNPVEIKADFDSYAMHLSGMKAGDWYYPVSVKIKAPDGAYRASIVTKSEKPMSFVLN